MQELADLAKLYTQCYSLVYSLSGMRVESEDERVIDWFHGVYAKYPWRGGYSAINFYHSLYAKIPYEQRPQIEEIQYASPGHIKLKEAALVAGLLAGIVTAVTTSFDKIHDSYNKIQNGMSERKLRKLEVELSELKLDQERLKFIQASRQSLIEQMKTPEVMQQELNRRTGGNELMQLKILMSFYRRVQPLSELELRGMLKVEQDIQSE
ncbi:MAG: hypothetical protein KYX62_04235 [Pseudomonadota bacterium]|nr:hypothetical protein [Pseudomonadota bacterium]